MLTITDSAILDFTIDVLFKGKSESFASVTVFDTLLTPDHLKIDKYLERLRKYMKSGPLVQVTTAVLLRRLYSREPSLFSESSAHRLLLTIYIIATKWSDDILATNSYYAKVGGISLKELNDLETCALRYLDYRCACTTTHRQEVVDWANALGFFFVATARNSEQDRNSVNA